MSGMEEMLETASHTAGIGRGHTGTLSAASASGYSHGPGSTSSGAPSEPTEMHSTSESERVESAPAEAARAESDGVGKFTRRREADDDTRIAMGVKMYNETVEASGGFPDDW